MSVQRQLLLETLDDLNQKEFKKFKWLANGDWHSREAIPWYRLEDADRMETVDLMTKTYGEEMAVNHTVEILKKMCNNNAAEKLKKRYAALGTTAAASTSAAAAPPPPAAPPAAAAAPAAPPPAAAAAAPPPPPPAVTMTAQQEGVLIAPTVTGGSIGTLNITFSK